MKKTIFFVMLVVSLSGNNIEARQIMTKENLIKEEWFLHDGALENAWTVKIKFKSDGTFITPDQYDENGTIVEGEYILKKKAIRLFYYRYSGHQDERGSKKVTQLRFVEDKNDLRYTAYYQCHNFLLGRSDFLVKKGSKRKVGETDIVHLGFKKAVATSNVKLRSGASIMDKPYQFIDIEAGIKTHYLPKGYEVVVLGRTTKKEKVHKWNNCWYYIDLVEYHYNQGDKSKYPKRAWVFGEFLKFK